MKDARPRFGYEPGVGVYDHKIGVFFQAIGTIDDEYGTWDLAMVASLISSGDFIDAAFTSHVVDKVAKARADFLNAEIAVASQIAAIEADMTAAELAQELSSTIAALDAPDDIQ